ncbi:hypothetical protein I302_103445 [Kwoniella bestiolae CBS 10118]|uniref:Uncharacterized protein n=1 Tax=Kwoniella bestiolae CBS 10118 TaxID=1296100 RepID=A0A1B9G8E0_9TREE|nr:hypothetical protein I302_02145 [Kwoniella bestiolae CBS 10118]OCF27304.1 hypothetical protein I302_02145 [Kwoniella bestiolae CBS 10118]
MPSIASSSRTRSHRLPLISLPLTTFVQPSSSSFPSPVSLPAKRGPSSLSVPSSPGSSKARKVSRTEKDGSETVRKARVGSSSKGKQREQPHPHEDVEVEVGVTPKIRNVLEKDDLGTGKSPARRLFVNGENPISGISGAIPTPPKSHRGLAPSPPISDSPFIVPTSLPQSDEIEVDVQAAPSPTLPSSELVPSTGDEADCGFTIYPSSSLELKELDELAASTILQLSNASGGSTSRPSSPSPSLSLSEIELNNIENQENLQPLPSTSVVYPPSPNSKSRSNRSTPSKYSSAGAADDEIISMYLSAPSSHSSLSGTSGSGTRRRERSKLINEVLLLRGESNREKEDMDEKMDMDIDGEEEELTPGRKAGMGGRERLRREVNMV